MRCDKGRVRVRSDRDWTKNAWQSHAFLVQVGWMRNDRLRSDKDRVRSCSWLCVDTASFCAQLTHRPLVCTAVQSVLISSARSFASRSVTLCSWRLHSSLTQRTSAPLLHGQTRLWPDSFLLPYLIVNNNNKHICIAP